MKTVLIIVSDGLLADLVAETLVAAGYQHSRYGTSWMRPVCMS
jgi:hypothetical protein